MRDTTPVLIGGSQITYRGDAATAPTPLRMLRETALAIAADAGLPGQVLETLDGIGVVGFALDAPGALADLPVPRLVNAPASLAASLGATPQWEASTHTGGNSSQMLINVACERVATGQSELVLAVGAEFLGSLMKRLKQGLGFEGYGDEGFAPPFMLGTDRAGVSVQEAAHGLDLPVNTYPLFENALRARDKRGLAEHQAHLGRLMSPFTKIAAANPHAWFRTAHSPEGLTMVTPQNRMISYPYPKLLNSILQVDQAAGVLIASVAKAREMGVSEENWVYLHGCADAHDLWNPLDRQNFHSSPAMRLTGARALDMAGVTLAQMDYFDLYSCFPSAVQIGAEELGLALDDPRGFTVTGGLPYFGGPGNNYAMHGVVSLREKLKARRGTWGLATANGWFLTKQSTGVYSTIKPARAFDRQDPDVLQKQIDAMEHPPVVEQPNGPAVVETYTVVHSRQGYRMGIVVGRDDVGRRFVAHTPREETLLREMEASEQIGRPGVVTPASEGIRNIFIPG